MQLSSYKGRILSATIMDYFIFKTELLQFQPEKTVWFVLRWPHTALSIQVLREWSWHILRFRDFNDAQSFHFLLHTDNGKHGLLMYNIKPNKASSCSFPGDSCCFYLRCSNVKFSWKGLEYILYNCTILEYLWYVCLFLCACHYTSNTCTEALFPSGLNLEDNAYS